MKFNPKDIIRNRKLILEGIKNKLFKKEHVEAEAKLRWKICKECIFLDEEGSHCSVPGTQPCCADCGCSLAIKLRSLSSECPKGNWLAVMTEEEEDELNKSMEENEENEEG